MRPPLQTGGFGNVGLSLLSMFQVVGRLEGAGSVFTAAHQPARLLLGAGPMPCPACSRRRPP